MLITSFDIYFHSFEDEYNVVGFDKSELSDKGFLNILKSSWPQNSENIIFSHLNINSIRNKFNHLQYILKSSVNILIVEDTKIVQPFSLAHFLIEGFLKSLRLDLLDRSSGLLVYVKSYIPSRQLIKFKTPSTIQELPFEMNLRREKWFFLSIYNPPLQSNQYLILCLKLLIITQMFMIIT